MSPLPALSRALERLSRTVHCPFCADETNRVVDTRLSGDGDEIRRRRECLECGRRFTTRERMEVVVPRIIKQDGRREQYAREKLQAGIERACEKRPVSVDAIERLLDRIERRLQEAGEKEVSSRYAGERAMEELVALDPIAAVRFASVFRNFQSADDYAEFFSSLSGKPEEAQGTQEVQRSADPRRRPEDERSADPRRRPEDERSADPRRRPGDERGSE